MILVLGCNGTLGRAVVEQLRRDSLLYQVSSAPIHVYSEMKRELSKVPKGSVIINCAGDIHRDPVNEDRMFASNTIGPRTVALVAKLYDLKVLHVSTDCVFHGAYGDQHVVEDLPSPDDFYGWTKSMGEVRDSLIVNVRTSFIAPNQGVWRDVRQWDSSKGPLVGWSGVEWSGSTVTRVALHLVMISQRMRDYEGQTIHLATAEPISKYDVIRLLDPHIPVRNEPFPSYSRALAPTIFMVPLADVLAEESL